MSTSNNNPSGTQVSVGPNTTPTPNPLLQTAQGLARGELAPNSTLQGTITQTQIALDEAKYEAPLNPKGQVLVEDFKQVLDSASRLLYEKNQDGKLQRLVGSAATAGRETRHGASGAGSGSFPLGRSDVQDFKGPARGFWDNGKSLGVFAVRSGQFREILIDLIDVLQGVADNTKRNLQNQSGQTSGTQVVNNMQNQTQMSQQQKDELFNKFQRLMNLLGSRPEYQTAMDHLLHMFDRIQEKANILKNDPNVPTSTADLPTQRYDQLWQEAKAVLEEFSGVGTFDKLERQIWTLSQEMKADPEAKAFLSRFRQYIREITTNPALLQNQAQVNYGRQLFEEGQYLFQGKYRNDFNAIFDQTRLILQNIKNDSARSDFSAKLHKLGADFAFDEQGRPDLFVIQESLSQMRTILIPVLSKQLANLPIPKIEGSNPKYDFSIDGMILHVGDLLPEFINFRTKTDTRMSVQRLATQKNTTKVVMEVDKIRAVFKDIRFFYRRKRVPKIEDHGIADVDLSQGTGVSVKIVWKLKSRMNQPYLLRLLKVKCSIDRLAITVRNAKHNVLDKVATKLFAGTIKKQMANAIVNNIISALQPLSVRLNDLFKRKPLTGVVGKANDSMKDHLFSGDQSQGGLVHRATAAVSNAAHQVQNIVNSGNTNSGNTNANTNPNTTGQVDRVIIVEQSAPTTIIVEQQAQSGQTVIVSDQATTYLEKERSIRDRASWNFEWYSPAPADTVEALSTVSPGTNSETIVIL